jgi:DNA-binding SARP family transcriptional activator
LAGTRAGSSGQLPHNYDNNLSDAQRPEQHVTITIPHQPKRTTTISNALGAVIQAAVLLGGIPYALTKYVGWPLPKTLPTIAQIRLAIELRDFSDRLLIGALACVAWICWALIVTSAFTHVIDKARHVNIEAPRIVPASLHRLVGKWISAITLFAALASKPAVAAIPTPTSLVTTSAPPAAGSAQQRPTPTTPTPATSNGSVVGGRTYRVGPRESLWSIAEATLGDGTRWKELLAANAHLIADPDILPDGIILTIPDETKTAASTTVTVEAGDNMWTISRHNLEDHYDRHVTNKEIAPYWVDVVKTNEPHIRSHNANLIYPGEHLELPGFTDEPAVADALIETEPTAQAVPAEPVPTIPAASVPQVTLPTTVPAVPRIKAAVLTPIETDTTDRAPWLYGLGLGGIGAAAVLAALAAKRRAITRAHTVGLPVPTLTPKARTLISELRGVAQPERLEAINRTLNFLWAQSAPLEKVAGVTVIRVGEHNVELLAANATTHCPTGFALLDDTTLVMDPTTDKADIDAAILDGFTLCPAMISIGTDDVGDLLIDVERIGAIAIEADTPEHAIGVLSAIAIEQTGLPWATENIIIAIGLPETITNQAHVETVANIDRFIANHARRIAAQDDETRQAGTHQLRLDGLELYPPTIILVGPGHDEYAEQLAALAMQPASGLAVIAAAPLSVSNWRLVVTNQQGEFEPNGINLTTINMHVTTIDQQVVESISELIDDDPRVTDEAFDDELPNDTNWPEEAFNDADDDDTVEPEAHDDIAAQAAVHFETPRDLQPLEEFIAQVRHLQGIELILLEGAPRLEGVQWNGKSAARADEVITFLALHRPACPREVGEALWPGKRNSSAQVSQAVSRARTLLGEHERTPRLEAAKRNSPYALHNVGCDWHRFQQLTTEAAKRCPTEAAELLKVALQLVIGRPFAQHRERSFDWVGDLSYELDISLTIASAAEHLARHALDTNDASLALWATAQGRLVVPTHESLIRLRIEAHAMNGDIEAARLEYDAALRTNEDENGLLSELDPETQALFAVVLAKATSATR